MNGLSLRDPQVLTSLAAVGVLVGGFALYSRYRERPDPLEIERKRRLELVKTGRIIDGTLLDVTELDAETGGTPGGMQLILYQYEIAGVVYECSQDVTHLKDFVDVHACRLGFPASIRYDVRRPENSIIVAETWTGVRDTAKPFVLRQPARNPAGATIPRR